MSLSTDVNYSKQISFLELLSIPPHKSELARILDISIIPEVVDYTLVETPQGLSYEGQYLSGINLIINFNLFEKLTYMSNTYDESVHSIHYTHLKSLSISLPQRINDVDTSVLIQSGILSIHPTIESIFTRILDTRTIHQSALLLVNISLN